MAKTKNQNVGSLHGSKKFVTIFILSLALAIIILDTTLLNVSLSTIIRELNTDIQSMQWVITAYSLTLAALTITGGRLGDLFGRKRMFVVGAIIFALGSFIASISINVGMMIAGEAIIEGIGAALMMPTTSSLLLANFKGRDRAMAFGIWGGIAGAASAIGPILGGFLATNYSWRWGFRINIFVAALLCIGSFFIPDSRDQEEKPQLDWLGVFLSATGLSAIVYGVIESSTYGWGLAKKPFELFGTTFGGQLSITPYAIGLSIVILILFLAWEQYMTSAKRTPLVSIKLFANRQFNAGVLTTMILSLGQAGIIFSIPVFLQSVRGYDALQTGLALLPMSLTLLFIAPLGGYLSGKIKPRLLINLGLGFNVLSMFVLRQTIGVDATSSSFIPGLTLYGLGMGLVMSQINIITLSSVSVQEAGEASGVNNTMRQVGSSFGSAVIGAVLVGTLSTNLVTGVQSSAVIPADYKATIATAMSQQTSNVEFGGEAKLNANIPPVIQTEFTAISHQATVDANRNALTYGIYFALAGLACSFLLPNTTKIERSKSVASGH